VEAGFARSESKDKGHSVVVSLQGQKVGLEGERNQKEGMKRRRERRW